MSRSLQRYRQTHQAGAIALPILQSSLLRIDAGQHNLAAALGLPEAACRGSASYYGDLRHDPDCVRVCTGTSCVLRGAAALIEAETSPWRHAYCLGHCDRSPVTLDAQDNVKTHDSRDVGGGVENGSDIRCESPVPIVTRRLLEGDASDFESARRLGAYDGLGLALQHAPRSVIEMVAAAGERGRGGAAFPTALKWRRCAETVGDEKFMIANGDEGDPGSFIDRVLMEQDPHGVIEGLAIGAYAIGARQAFVFVRSEYPKAQRRMQQAVAQALAAGVLGPSVMGSTFSLEITVVAGLGSYVCGEETAMINAMEGARGEVRIRPPYPTESGLFARPTVVDNVETLINVPWIIANGPDAYAALGTAASSGTKAMCLNAGFARPGIVEVEFGSSLSDVIFTHGGGCRDDGELDLVLLGGPMGSVLRRDEWEVPICYDAMAARGVRLGHGGVVAVPRGADLKRLLLHWLRFMRDESCGKCEPCALGSGYAFKRAQQGVTDESLDNLLHMISRTSLCAFGKDIPRPIRKLLATINERESEG